MRHGPLTLEGTINQLNALPTPVLEFYTTINQLLYAEPGFSDVTPADLLIPNVAEIPDEVGAYLQVLVGADLIWVEATEVNGFPCHFIHTFAHDEGWVKDGKVVGPHHRGFNS